MFTKSEMKNDNSYIVIFFKCDIQFSCDQRSLHNRHTMLWCIGTIIWAKAINSSGHYIGVGNGGAVGALAPTTTAMLIYAVLGLAIIY